MSDNDGITTIKITGIKNNACGYVPKSSGITTIKIHGIKNKFLHIGAIKVYVDGEFVTKVPRNTVQTITITNDCTLKFGNINCKTTLPVMAGKDFNIILTYNRYSGELSATPVSDDNIEQMTEIARKSSNKKLRKRIIGVLIQIAIWGIIFLYFPEILLVVLIIEIIFVGAILL